MTAKILAEFKQRVAELKLIPAGGGCFELTADGDLLYSKLKTGQFPEEGAIIKELARRMKSAAQ